MWNVKEAVAHRALAARPREGRLVLPAEPGRLGQGPGREAHRRPGRLRVRPHRRSGRAAPAARHRAARRPGRPAGRAGARRRGDGRGGAGGQPVPQGSIPAAKPQPGPGRPGGLAGRIEATVASSPRLKRTVRELSSRSPAVRRLRILAWRALEREPRHGAPDRSRARPDAAPDHRHGPSGAGRGARGRVRRRGRGRGHLQPAGPAARGAGRGATRRAGRRTR